MSAKPDSESKYKDTIFLPDTPFPMRAGLPENEPKWLAKWAEAKMYQRLREDGKNRPIFVFHDGPPYANGNIHIGHALNKILKDFVVRSQQMMGRDAHNIPGWDCHGLPIEWKVEEEYRAKGIDKDTVPAAEFRARCRAYAEHWIGEQKREFIRLGCVGDWDNAYKTMSFDAEAQIVREILKFKDNGLLYRGSKPVMWSVVEKTALAEAEVEYQEKKSPQIWLRFPIVDGPAHLKGADVVIWTTTPWTIPANRAIAFSPRIAYGLYEVSAVQDGSLAAQGLRLILADKLAEDVSKGAKATFTRLQDAGPLTGIVCAHPLRGKGYDFAVPLLPGEHVTDDTGTGFVHTAPGHGLDDFWLWMSNPQVHPKSGDVVPHTVDADGSFYAHVPLFAGKRILTREGKDGDANGAVIKELMEAGKLLAKGSFTHSYPHSWRSKAPLIFRNTPQWFLSMDRDYKAAAGGEGTLRERALAEIKKTKWVPPQGENRLSAMVKDKPDWVLSRQRAWGVPIAVFVRKADGKVLDDKTVDKRIADTIDREGADAWFSRPAADFLGNDYNPDDFEKVDDILDVWFESGATHAYVLEGQMGLKDTQADLYLEGSDQHRGWFQSSLIESVGTRGRAPYKAVATHGFTLDEQGRKMSKSLGNTVEPAQVLKEYGADILRLWVASTSYTEDQYVGPKILKAVAETYRKLRNTMRYILASLKDWNEAERVDPAQMPELERYILHRLSEVDAAVRKGYAEYDFNEVYNRLNHFCVSDLSAFYFDIRKDALYCDAATSIRRRSARTVLDHLFNCLTAWLSPVLCFTMEEAWATRGLGKEASVHLRQFPTIPDEWRDEALAKRWDRLRDIRRVVTGALELARASKQIGSSLEAAPKLYLADAADRALFSTVDLNELAITSQSSIVPEDGPAGAFRLPDVKGAAALFARADGGRCDRCWRVLPEVGTISTAPDLCGRCDDALKA